MRLEARHRTLAALSVLSLFASISAVPNTASPSTQLLQHDRRAAVDAIDSGKSTGVKLSTSEHAPVDGKDGIPKTGPWVETNAERTREKLKEQPDDPKSLSTFKEGLKEKDIPKSNDGVMDDPTRKKPTEGTRGVEGGITQKSRTKETTIDDDTVKRPESPKEVSKHHQAEEQKSRGKTDTKDPGKGKDKDKDAIDNDTDGLDSKKNLQKPVDLPEKPHDIPLPENPSSPKDDSIIQTHFRDTDTGAYQSPLDHKQHDDHEPAVIQPMHSLLLSFAMILVSEIGDKTFLVACLMAMRHDRILVFTAAFSALITMTVLSAVLGHAVPTLIPKTVTNFLAAALFLIFGVKMLLEARKISPDEGVSEEMKEVEMELEEKEQRSARRLSRHNSHATAHSLHILESGRNKHAGSPSSSAASSRSTSPSRESRWTTKNVCSGLNNLLSLLLSPAWVQTFVMTFLGEWGDRSQIATIAMAAGQDYWWVTAGALGGHAICTGMAVIGGKAIAGRVSLRTVTMGGAIAFLVFGVIYLAEAVY